MASMATNVCCRLFKQITHYSKLRSTETLLLHCKYIGNYRDSWNANIRFLSGSQAFLSQKTLEKAGVKVKKVVTEDGVVEVKKKVYLERVTVLIANEDMKILTLEEATKLGKRRNLKLIKVAEPDSKTNRATYKLVSPTSGIEKTEAVKKGDGKHNEKLLTIKSKISDNDLQSKIRHIHKWIEKESHIRVVIAGEASNLKSAERLFDSISQAVKDKGRVVQKVLKGNDIKFQIIPPKKVKEKSELTADENE